MTTYTQGVERNVILTPASHTCSLAMKYTGLHVGACLLMMLGGVCCFSPRYDKAKPAPTPGPENTNVVEGLALGLEGFSQEEADATKEKTAWRPINAVASLPDSSEYDWSEYMPPAKNQEKCADCWSFAMIAQVEAWYNSRPGGALLAPGTCPPRPPLAFSEQHLTECIPFPFSHGCDAAHPAWIYTEQDQLPFADTIWAQLCPASRRPRLLATANYFEIQKFCEPMTIARGNASSDLDFYVRPTQADDGPAASPRFDPLTSI